MTIVQLGYNDLYVPSYRTTVDLNFFNKRFKAIYDALMALDAVVSTYGAAETTLIELGLSRLNETLGPLLTTLQNASDLGFLVAKSTGTAHSLVETEAVGWVIDSENRDLFTPTPYLLAQDDNDSTNWGLLSLDVGGWTKSTGELATHVEYASKTQSSSSWTISANSAVLSVMQTYVATCQAAQAATAADVTTVQDAIDQINLLIEQMGEAGVASINGLTGIVSLDWDEVYGLSDQLDLKATTTALTSGLASKQNSSAKLDTFVNLSWSSNKIIYATGAGTLGTLPVSEYAKTLLDDTDASTALSTLGVSTFAKTILDDADAATVRTTLGITDPSTIDGGSF
jgi:hypothetical protein